MIIKTELETHSLILTNTNDFHSQLIVKFINYFKSFIGFIMNKFVIRFNSVGFQ